MVLRDALRATPVGPAVGWLGARWRHYRKPRVRRQNDTYDLQTMDVLRRVRGNYLDIGAAGGSIMRQMLLIAPDGRHVGFEPLPDKAAKFRARFPHVELHQVALGDTRGPATFHYAKDDPGRSGLRHIEALSGSAIERIRVEVNTLDALVHHPVQAIKLDVEGAELAVLRGGRRLITEHRPVIVFEHGVAAAHFATSHEDVFDLLDEYGYDVYLLPRWLRGGRPLGRAAFAREATTRNWYFVASHRQTLRR